MARLARARDLSTKGSTRTNGYRDAVNTKTASPISKLRLVYSPDSTDDLMHRANAHLAARQPYQALQIYSQVLSSKTPGHPCALLNRSLAYIALGYPELAVADAYRAAMGAYGMRQANTLSGNRMLKAVAKYTRSENLAKKSGEPWATEPTCYPEPVWLGVPLGAIFLHVDQVRLDVNARESVCVVLELKAIYRMAYALWKCGGGAVSDALGLLCDAKASYKLTGEEEFSIVSLGNQMMFDIGDAMDSEDQDAQECGESGLSYNHLASAGKKKASGVREMMRRRYTCVRREVYPWNSHEPNLEDSSVVASLNRAISDITLGTQLRLLPREPGRGPQLALFSTRDIEPGSLLLREVSSLQVINNSSDQSTSMHCNNCASSLIAPANLRDDKGNKPLGDAFNGSFSTAKSTSDDDEEDAAHFSQKQKIDSGAELTPPGTPPKPPPQRNLPADIKICPDCDRACFCSRTCQEEARADYHQVLCGSGVEEGIYEAIQKHKTLAHQPVNAEAEQIYELLLMRIFALAKEKGIHPLDLDEVRWLDGDFFAAPDIGAETPSNDAGEPLDVPASQLPDSQYDVSRKTLPWSFEANVVRPIKWLTKMGLKPIENLERCDGWIVNTLLAKIMASTRITRGSRHVKVYDASGRLVTGLEAGLRRCANEDGGVCVGSIYPIFSHIRRVRNESEANLVVRDGGSVSCFAREGGHGGKGTTPDVEDEGMEMAGRTSSHGPAGGQEDEVAHFIKAGSLISRHADAF